jgi:hypothetical protein
MKCGWIPQSILPTRLAAEFPTVVQVEKLRVRVKPFQRRILVVGINREVRNAFVLQELDEVHDEEAFPDSAFAVEDEVETFHALCGLSIRTWAMRGPRVRVVGASSPLAFGGGSAACCASVACASDLLVGLPFDARGCVVVASCFRRLHRVEGRVIIYALFELFQHFNGSADLGCGWSSHDQTWMPRECLRAGDCRWHRFRGGSHCAFRACSAVTGCAHGDSKPSLPAVSSAACLVGASITVRNGSPISRADCYLPVFDPLSCTRLTPMRRTSSAPQSAVVRECLVSYNEPAS